MEMKTKHTEKHDRFSSSTFPPFTQNTLILIASFPRFPLPTDDNKPVARKTWPKCLSQPHSSPSAPQRSPGPTGAPFLFLRQARQRWTLNHSQEVLNKNTESLIIPARPRVVNVAVMRVRKLTCPNASLRYLLMNRKHWERSLMMESSRKIS